jgi:hypothetical protein
MNCDRFELLLDAHGPDDLPADALAHAAMCARCERALAAARSIDTLLVAPTSVAAPSGFTDRVLARIRTTARAPQASPVMIPIAKPFDPLPEWIRFVAEPATAGALVVAALIVWQAPRLLSLGRALASSLAARVASASTIDPGLWPEAMRAAFASDAVRLALVVAGCSLTPLVAFSLYRWTERLAAGGMRRR